MDSLKRSIILIAALLFGVAEGSRAQSYITDVMTVDSQNHSTYTAQGWTVIGKDLNAGAGGKYIYLLYKTNSSQGSSGTPITGFYIKTGEGRPGSISHGGRTYYPVTANGAADLNSGANGAYIYLYYTKDAFSPARAVTSIYFNSTSAFAVGANGGTSGGYDLNSGAHGEYIYMHVVADATQNPIDVYNESQLREAVTLNNAVVRMMAHIDISSVVEINDSKTVTLDLNGKTLNRGLSSAANNGHALKIISGSKLTITDSGSGGTITGGYSNEGGAIGNYGTLVINGGTIWNNKATNRGGAIYNYEGASVTINGGSIEYNAAIANDGGAIYNKGTVTMSGGRIFHNGANTAGGGIWNSGTFTFSGGSISENNANRGGAVFIDNGTATVTGGTITDNHATGDLDAGLTHAVGGGIFFNNGTLYISGNPVISGNIGYELGSADNLGIAKDKKITAGHFTEGVSIGISIVNETALPIFTTGYYNNNQGVNPVGIFFADDTRYHIEYDQGEVRFTSTYGYIERDWDSSANTIVETRKECSDFTMLTGNTGSSNTELGDGWYVLNHSVTYNKNLRIVGNAKIILCDGCTLTAQGGISIQTNKRLYVYGQEEDSGKIYTHARSGPGIGGTGDILAGSLIIHGGIIDAKSGSNNNAGIGGGNGNGSGIQSVVILGGSVTAEGGDSAAGIGKGLYNNYWEDIRIFGGTVKAIGGEYGAGIGGGEDRGNGTITIWGGHVEAEGGYSAAGIGGGEEGDQDRPITIHGGYVRARGSSDSSGSDGGAGIGGGYKGNGGTVTINGGTVYAYGNRHSAGIGGGSEASGGTVTINGGEVYAKCSGSPGRGAGIGGGYKGNQGGTITINGGVVNAETSQGAGIGGGFKGHGSTIIITDGLVTAKSKDGAGIGGGSSMDGGGGGNGANVTISGGVVIAVSEKKGAGIGGGNDGNGGTVKISGGHVTAVGGQFDTDYWQDELEPDYTGIIKGFGGHNYHGIVVEFLKELLFSGSWGGAGIGGGDDGNGANVTITGGTVIASASNAYAIGRGDGGGGAGDLSLYDDAEVLLRQGQEWVPQKEADRVSTCHWKESVMIKPCDHSSVSYTIDNAHDSHTVTCLLCKYHKTERHQTDQQGNCVCGYGLGTCEISLYMPSEAADGSYDCHSFVIGKTKDFQIPSSTPRVGSLQFEGWMRGTPANVNGYEWVDYKEPLLEEDGILHEVSEDIALIARYKEYWTGSGIGTEGDPYLIATTDDLDQLATRINNGADFTDRYFLLVNDIVYDGTENNYTPIGCYQSSGIKSFNGVFLGNGHTISGINVTRSGSGVSASGVGVFGFIGRQGYVYDLRVKDCTFAGNQWVGSIAGWNLGRIERCLVIDGDVQGREYVGRIVGYNERWVHYNYYTADGKNGIGGNSSASNVDNVYGGNRGYVISCTNSLNFQYVESPGTGLTLNAVLECDGILYAPAGVTINMEVSSRDGNTITVLKYNDQILEPKKEGVYTFTMPSADVLISATIDLDAISLRDDYANLEVLSGNTGKITNVTLHGRTLWKDGSWNTICLPFALSDQDIATGDCPLHGARIKTLSGATFLDGVLTLSFSDASSIEAGKPYIVMWDPGTDISDPVFLGVTIVDTEPESVVADNVTFTGIFSPVSLTANDKTKLYLGADNKLYYAQKDLDINSFRGYFVLGDGIQLNSVQRIVLDIDDIRIK